MTDNIQIVLQKDQNGNFVATSDVQDSEGIKNVLNSLETAVSGAIDGILRTADVVGLEESKLIRLTSKGKFIFDITTGAAKAINQEISLHGDEKFKATIIGSFKFAAEFGFNSAGTVGGSALGFTIGATTLNPLIAAGGGIGGALTGSLWAEDVYHNETIINGKTPEQLINQLAESFYKNGNNSGNSYVIKTENGSINLINSKLNYTPIPGLQLDAKAKAVELLTGIKSSQDQSISNISEIIITQPNYKVKQGDTLSKIAANNHISLQSLLEANPSITNPNLIYVGDEINIPSTYKIEKGDVSNLIKSDASGEEFIGSIKIPKDKNPDFYITDEIVPISTSQGEFSLVSNKQMVLEDGTIVTIPEVTTSVLDSAKEFASFVTQRVQESFSELFDKIFGNDEKNLNLIYKLKYR